MKKTILIFTSLLLTQNIAMAELGNGGMSECLALSVRAAIDEYAMKNAITPIPTFTVSKSDGSPSNGIDVMVTVNSKITYYIIATPVSTPDHITLLGCSNAVVGYTK